MRKYYGHDFGSSPASLVAFAQSVLEAVPSALDRLAQYSAVSSLDEKLLGIEFANRVSYKMSRPALTSDVASQGKGTPREFHVTSNGVRCTPFEM